MINVTKPFLPPREEYEAYVRGIWERNWLTNNGPLVRELEEKLTNYTDVNHLLYVGNGTIALQLAIKALGLQGEVITTPFSYVATSSSLVWENCVPVYADIDPHTFNIDPKSIAECITDETTAILATHVYGIPCDVEAIEHIAREYNLKVIYDAAHAFGVKYKGRSLFSYGDIATTSFHATKLFHTIEGGAVMCESDDLREKLFYMRNFGHNGPEVFSDIGINGKNSEFHAAMGLVNLNYIDHIIQDRRQASKAYDDALTGLNLTRPSIPESTEYNYAYYPVVFESEKVLLDVVEEMTQNEISPRRYFYPNLDTLPYVEKADIPNADSVAVRVLCLPLFTGIEQVEIDKIVGCIRRILS
jgi:dTDP-4-amino-4,6-dideoxygalactose transaminase